MKSKLLTFKWYKNLHFVQLKTSFFLVFISLLFTTSVVAQSWVQIGAEETQSTDEVVYDIAINASGTIKAVVTGTADNEFLKVYKFIDNSWVQIGNNITFSASSNYVNVSLSGNGNVVAIARPHAAVNGFDKVGAVDIYNVNANGLGLVSHLDGWYTHVNQSNDGENDEFGNSIELNYDGSKIAIGVRNYNHVHNVDDSVVNSGILGIDKGEVRLYAYFINVGYQLEHTFGGYFTFDDTNSGSDQYIGTGNYGNLVAFSDDGLTMATTAFINQGDDSLNQNMVRVFRYLAGWYVLADINLPSYQISDLVLNNNGNTLAFSNTNKNYNKGAVEIYKYDGTDYNLNKTIAGFYNNDGLGCSIALDATGNKIAIGARNDNGDSRGQVKIYEKNETNWDFIQKLTGDSYYNHSPFYNDNFGFKVDLSTDGTTFIAASHKINTGLKAAQVEAFKYLSAQIPNNFSATNITTTSVDLKWDYVIGSSTYIVQYRKIGTENWTTETTQNTVFSINNLLYNTEYEAQIKQLYSDENSSDFSSSLLFTTLPPTTSDLTYVPDTNFEQALIDEGLDDVLDDYVITNNVSSIGFLDISNKNIADLTGIEDFTELETFGCDNNQLTSLDLSSNHIMEINCAYNQLTSLILNAEARVVDCSNNLLTELVVPSGIANLQCNNNNITSLDLTNTTELSRLNVSSNQLTFLDFKNGENGQITSSYDYNTGDEYDFDATNNPDLTCIIVDDADFSTTNWKKVDATSHFVESKADCEAISVQTITIPDLNFEHYLETHTTNGGEVLVGDTNSLGNGIDGDHLVIASKIKAATALRLSDLNISDVTGLEYFTALTDLSCANNSITSITLPEVKELANLYISGNQINALTFPDSLTTILEFGCNDNNLSSINFNNVTYINFLFADNNQLERLDVSTVDVEGISCNNNPVLTNIDFRNGADYTEVYSFSANNNPLLTCIFVDDVTYATTNWATSIDTTASFVLNEEECTSLSSQTYVPDDNFEQVLIDAQLDDVLDDYVFTANIKDLTFLDVSNKNISDLTGIEDFKSLVTLSCHDNLLTSLDVTQNTSLTYVSFSFNQISTIDVSKNIALEKLIGVNNQLTALDVTKNTSLKHLECWMNQIGYLDLSKNANLEELYVDKNELTALDVTHNNALKNLSFGGNMTKASAISSIDISNNTELESLAFIYTQVSEIVTTNNPNLKVLFVRNNKLENIDVSQNPVLEDLVCEENQLRTLNVKNGNNSNFYRFSAFNNSYLSCIQVDDPAWSATNWTNINGQETFGDNCHYYQTYVPDNNFEQALIDLGYDTGSLDDYVVTDSINSITDLYINNKNIADLTGLEDFDALTYLECTHNALTSLSTTSNEELGVLRCNNNALTSLDINGNVNLTQLYCGYNNLTSLDYLYNAPYLNFLSIENNQIATLDISANQELLNLFVDGNGLSSLDVTNNSKLTVISANNNQLKSLDISNNPDLFYLYLSINELTELDVSNNPDVSRLIVRSNLLTNLDLRNGNNTKISNGTFNTINNPNLSCIYVDNVAWSATNWTNIDDTSHFVADEAECTSLAVANYEFNGLKIISNPTSEYIKLSIEEEANFVLIDLNGKILRKGKLTVGNNAIPVSSISKGLCLLKITNTRNSSVKKIIIQ